jgi:hypothetical protein
MPHPCQILTRGSKSNGTGRIYGVLFTILKSKFTRYEESCVDDWGTQFHYGLPG